VIKEKDMIAMKLAGTSDAGHRASTVSLARDLVLLLARIGLGVLMVVHAKLEYAFAGGNITGSGRCSRSPAFPWALSPGR
jgi:predicted nucleotidyltransferase